MIANGDTPALATTTAAATPGGQRSDARTTTLLDLLFDLRPQSDGCERSLVTLALDAITAERVALSGNYRGVEPTRFAAAH